jgi:hypothetical protein
MVLNGGELGCRWFGGANAHLTVKLSRIGREYLRLVMLGQSNGGSGFANSRWAGYANEILAAAHVV